MSVQIAKLSMLIFSHFAKFNVCQFFPLYGSRYVPFCSFCVPLDSSQYPSTYSYDATSGFYYDSASGLYYDPKTQVLVTYICTCMYMYGSVHCLCACMYMYIVCVRMPSSSISRAQVIMECMGCVLVCGARLWSTYYTLLLVFMYM